MCCASRRSCTTPNNYAAAASWTRFGEIVGRLAGLVNRFTTTLDCLDIGFLPDETLDQLPLPSQIGATRVGGIDFEQTPDPRRPERGAHPERRTWWLHRHRPGHQSAHDHREH